MVNVVQRHVELNVAFFALELIWMLFGQVLCSIFDFLEPFRAQFTEIRLAGAVTTFHVLLYVEFCHFEIANFAVVSFAELLDVQILEFFESHSAGFGNL